MAEIALAVVEPNGRRWAQLLDDARPVREVLRVVLENLRLPKDFKYQLIATRTRQTLREAETLRQAGIAPGDELQLQPERDGLLAKFLESLYDQVKDHVADQLWELATEKLETLFRLDPYYPDRDGLRQAVTERSVALARQVAGNRAAERPRPARETPPPVAAPPTATTTPPTAAPAKRSSLGSCLLTLVVIVAIAGVGAAVMDRASLAGIAALLSDLGVRLGTPTAGLPGREGEPRLGTGDVQITLRWDGAADLDLHVIDPQGEEIWFSHTQSDSGGALDVDANADCREARESPVENVFWPTGGAPQGEYQVIVEYFRDCAAVGATGYEVTVRLDGQPTNVLMGTVNAQGDRQPVTTFQYP